MRVILYKILSNEKVLYNLSALLEKLCIAKKKIGVFCDKSNISIIDKTLWTCSTNFFVPHEISSNDVGEGSEMFDNALQPVLLATNLHDIADREIICVFNDIDFEKVFFYLKDKKDGFKFLTKDIIYMVNENNIDMTKIKELVINNDINGEKNTLDIYVKNGLKWEKIKE